MRSSVFQAGLVALSLAACSQGSVYVNDGLIQDADYPEVIDAQLIRGTISKSDACLTLIAQDGARMIPIFPEGSSMRSFQESVGDLTDAVDVTVSAVTMTGEPSARLAKALSEQNCDGTPFYFGHFQRGIEKLPAPSPVN